MELLLQQTARAQEKEEEDGPGPLLAVWSLDEFYTSPELSPSKLYADAGGRDGSGGRDPADFGSVPSDQVAK